MKNRFFKGFAILTVVLVGVFAITLQAQTTEEGPAPSDQPSAPMEMGQPGPNNPDDMDADTGSEPPQIGDSDENGPSGEKPAETDQGVARISMIHGDVSTQRGDSGDWSAAALNAPVVTGDKVSTADGARVELELDFANTLRLARNSKVNIANLTKKNIQVQLSEGMISYSVVKDGDAEPEIDTPNVSVHPSHHDGVFRVEVRPDGDTIVIVRKGEAQISTPQGSAELKSGEMATVRGTSESAQYKISDAPDRDDWDKWTSDRDRLIRNASSWKHTNRYYTGSQDLDAYGNWQHVSDYGDVWVPNEDSDWVPYRNGNWTYEPYYGWTWVGYEPWGWAPYHYGRWFLYGSRWAWWPGPLYGGGFYRPFWSPAYVSFFGWGGGWGFGVGYGGWGGFGWLPIGPCDRFYPWWGGYRGRFGVVNFRGGHLGRYGGFGPLHGGNRFSNLARIHDSHMSRALSTVHAGRFGNGPVRAVGATRAQINGARMMTGNMPVVPTRASLSASGRAASPSTIRNGGAQHFFGSAHNNVSRPASFQQQTAGLQRSMQQSRVSGIQAGGDRAGKGGFQSRNPANGTAQRPSAGIAAGNREQGGREGNSNHQMSNSGLRNSGNNSQFGQNHSGQNTSQNTNRGGFKPFNPPSSNRSEGNSARSPAQSNTAPRSFGSSSPSQGQGGDRGGFHPFTPPTHGAPAAPSGPGRSNNSPSNGGSGNGGGYWNRTAPNSTAAPSGSGRSNNNLSNRSSGNSGSYWNRTAPSSPVMRGGSSSMGNYGRGSSSRPQLDMRQPVVQPRSSRSYPGGGYPGGSRSMPSYGGSHGAPSYGGGRSSPPPTHSAPSFRGGGHSAPSGGHSSAPSGGGHSSGGGGGRSSGGGGHSSGGHH